MEYITRQEKYLAYLAQLKTGKLPAPQTREEIYLAAIAGLYKKPLPYPQTRVETYLKAIADGKTTGLPDPKTRKEYYLYAIATDDTQRYIPTPITREEQLLDKVVNILVGVEDVTVSGNGSAMLYNAANHGFTGLTLYGKSSQGSTTGAQLFDASLLGNTRSASVECSGSNIIITALEDGEYRQASSVSIGFLEAGDQICIAAETFPKDNAVVIRDSNGVNNINVIISNESQSVITIPDNGTYLVILCINKSVPVKAGTVGVFSKLIINKGNVPKDYEPYTGGKPSPSPEYPQEIRSVGDIGKISVNILGKNLIPFKKIPTLTEKGITITTKSNGIVHFKGTATAAYDSPTISLQEVCLPSGRYRAFPTINSIRFHVVIKKRTGDKLWQNNIVIIEDGDEPLYCYFTIDDGASVDNDAYVYMQMDNGEILSESDFEPYKSAQPLIIPTPNGLPGIPVPSGGNYTDADGQQWVCDEVDFKKGVYVQRVAKEIPKTSFNVGETTDVKGRYSFIRAFKNVYKDGRAKCLISHGIYGTYGVEKNTWAIVSTAFVYSPAERTTVDKIKEKILSLINSDNPLTFLGQLETPIEKPLTTEQLATYKALRTYSPTTTVTNDAGADMKITYRCNLKKTESELEALYADTEREFREIEETEDKEE